MSLGRPIRLLGLWAALLAAPVAWAASCTITNSGISFGAYDPLSVQPRDTNATIQNTCQGLPGENVSYSIAVNEVSGSGAVLTLSNGSTTLQYDLYLDIGRTVIWGDGTNGTSMIQDSYTLASSPVNKSYPVYGRIAGGQSTATPGTYTDSLMITVNY
jgi:spore coat protein U-like protein